MYNFTAVKMSIRTIVVHRSYSFFSSFFAYFDWKGCKEKFLVGYILSHQRNSPQSSAYKTIAETTVNGDKKKHRMETIIMSIVGSENWFDVQRTTCNRHVLSQWQFFYLSVRKMLYFGGKGTLQSSYCLTLAK